MLGVYLGGVVLSDVLCSLSRTADASTHNALASSSTNELASRFEHFESRIRTLRVSILGTTKKRWKYSKFGRSEGLVVLILGQEVRTRVVVAILAHSLEWKSVLFCCIRFDLW